MKELLKLLFPQWQGSGIDKDLYYGALEIKDTFLNEQSFEYIDVSMEEELAVKNGILGYDSIILQLKKAIAIISDYGPRRIFTIGGDCGIELAPISYLNNLYNGDLAVIWFDAHGDLNTPALSPSNKFHGMPLRFLLGDGDKSITGMCLSRLNPNQMVLAGCRELDPPEQEYIHSKNIRVIRADKLEKLIKIVSTMGFNNIYIHLDLDVIDPECFPSVMCPSEKGIMFHNLMVILELLKKEINIIGFSVVEYKKSYGAHIGKLRDIINFGCSL